MVSSENPTWETQLNQAVIKQKYDQETQIIVISTITSFYLKRFGMVIMKSTQEKMLIVDEAHRFTKLAESIKKANIQKNADTTTYMPSFISFHTTTVGVLLPDSLN